MKHATLVTAGLAIAALLAVIDLVSLIAFLVGGGPPLWSAVGGAVIGAATLVAVFAAWRGSRSALLAVIACRLVDLLRGIGALLDDTPTGAKVVIVVMEILTIASAALLVTAYLGTARGTTASGDHVPGH